MAEDSQKQNLSAAYELLKQGTHIGEADTFEELGPATHWFEDRISSSIM